MHAPHAARRGTPAIPMERVTRRQGRWLGSFRHESYVSVFYRHDFLTYGSAHHLNGASGHRRWFRICRACPESYQIPYI